VEGGLRGRLFYLPRRHPLQGRDPNDEMVLEVAINGRAGALVTYNIADFAAAERFKIAVLRPAELLKKVKL
jgi:predicted nucleic acid-binding protein